jgi:hypothetical protein
VKFRGKKIFVGWEYRKQRVRIQGVNPKAKPGRFNAVQGETWIQWSRGKFIIMWDEKMQQEEREKEIVTDEMVDLVLRGVDLDSLEKQLKESNPNPLQLKESLIGVARDAYLTRFDLREETEKDREIKRLVRDFVFESSVRMSQELEARSLLVESLPVAGEDS